MIRKAWAIMVSAGLLGSLYAGGDTDIAALQLGKQLMGPPVSVQNLTGKVVMVEFWGTH